MLSLAYSIEHTLYANVFFRRTISMKQIGIIRKTDKLGRIVIPKEIRDFFDIDICEPVEILATENGVLIRKANYKPVNHP